MRTESGINSFENIGTGLTVKVSVADPLVPRLEVKFPDVLTKSPELFAMTSTEIVQVEPSETVPPLYCMTEVPDVAVIVPPVHVFTTFAGVATSIPEGRSSVKFNDVASTVEVELSIVNVKVVTLLIMIVLSMTWLNCQKLVI